MGGVDEMAEVTVDAVQAARQVIVTVHLKRQAEMNFRLWLAVSIMRVAIWLADKVGPVRFEED